MNDVNVDLTGPKILQTPRRFHMIMPKYKLNEQYIILFMVQEYPATVATDLFPVNLFH